LDFLAGGVAGIVAVRRHAFREIIRPQLCVRGRFVMIGGDHRLALPAGHFLAEFRITKVLGQGGFGITYLARDTLLKVDVAIKELLPRDFATRVEGVTVVPRRPEDGESLAWAKQRFINEARILAGLRHESIVHVYRFLEAHGTAYMVMEFVQGQNLLDWMRKHRRPSEGTLRAILLPLLDGLESVHRKNVLHRDISPENILITAENRPMLLDFGAARNTVDKHKTITGIVRPGYSPVEQYQTESPQGAYTDIYAMAAVMAHAITGNVPPLSIDRCGSTDPFQPLSERYRGKYGEHFLRALDMGFAVAPEVRPQSVAQWRQMFAGDFSKGKSTPRRDRPAERQEERKDSKRVSPPQPVPKKTHAFPWLLFLAVFALVGGGLAIFYAITGPPKDGGGDVTNNGASGSNSATLALGKDGSYVNSLSMKFVTVPGTKVLFCVHQTRRADYQVFANAHPGTDSAWESAVALNRVPVGQEPTHPVVMVSWNEASAFCKWLSDAESRRSGRTIAYRLPRWEEWRQARGSDKYPWGNEKVPPKGWGNYADVTARRIFGANFTFIANYDDGFATTSPVGTFAANKVGLVDFGSNVQEWSADQDLGTGEMLVLGASWKDSAPDVLACREKPQYHESADSRRTFVGFRCVVSLSGK
jgi:serine/threonine protein kinase